MRSIFGSIAGSRDYRAGAGAARVLLLAACDDTSGPTIGDTGPTGTELSVVEAAEAGALLPLARAPGEALRTAWAWEADADALCPTRVEAGELLTLSGGCTTAGGAELRGSVTRDRAPDGGHWEFAALSVTEGGVTTRWDGPLVWVQTDGANNLTAYDFSAANEGVWSAAYASLAGRLDDVGRLVSVRGTPTLRLDAAPDAEPLAVMLDGTWDFGDCDAHPTAGTASWVANAAADGNGESVSATFEGLGCEACVPWLGSEGEAGEWCPL